MKKIPMILLVTATLAPPVMAQNARWTSLS